MSVLVKICGLNDARHVKAAVDAGADAIGFVFASSVRQVTPDQAATYSAGVPPHIRRVAVMLHPADDEWLAVMQAFRPDVLQTDAEDFAALEIPDSIEHWPVYREGGRRPDTDGVYVYEGQKSGRGETVDWSQAATIAADGKMILAGGLAATNVAEAISRVRPFGVDVSSAVESTPAQKDPQLILEFVRAVRAAEKNL